MTNHEELHRLATAANRSGHYTPLQKVVTPDVVLALLADFDALRTRLAEVEKDAANSKPNCRECTKWAQEQADNREWIDAVARGKVICKQLASEAMKGV